MLLDHPCSAPKTDDSTSRIRKIPHFYSVGLKDYRSAISWPVAGLFLVAIGLTKLCLIGLHRIEVANAIADHRARLLGTFGSFFSPSHSLSLSSFSPNLYYSLSQSSSSTFGFWAAGQPGFRLSSLLALYGLNIGLVAGPRLLFFWAGQELNWINIRKHHFPLKHESRLGLSGNKNIIPLTRVGLLFYQQDWYCLSCLNILLIYSYKHKRGFYFHH
ncbi:unnamed protein product [Protopolystoma xenopodis]|uniref:Uncharacterized protein n=1 Tax=Protopolystoma xenopodis TaxID=117903 RepID=A0A448WWM8_9PLAT|nr:unnamed protein product [Protopolystoma xenopodis]